MDEEAVRGTVEWEGRRITVEGPPDFVSAELDRFRTEPTDKHDADVRPADSGARPATDAEFVAQKKPQDHYEKIAVLAFRLKNSGKLEFDSEDMRRAYIRAGIKPPKVMQQALIDTKRKKDYVEPTATRGSYRLTDFGSDFVQFDMPRKENSK